MQENRRIILISLENQAGALARVVGLFAQRNYNIDSLSVAPTHDSSLSSLTITTYTSNEKLEQIIKQLNKLIEVYSVENLTENPSIEREVLLITVKADQPHLRSEIKHLADIFRSQIVNVTPDSYTIQVVGTSDKVLAFMNSLEATHILSVTRSGLSVIKRPIKNL